MPAPEIPVVTRLAERIEKAVAALIVGASLLFLWPFARTMATTSLWNDEICTNIQFSGHGPARVLTFYGSNSHVLFNLVNSVVPGRRSMDPLRARLFSFIAIAALLVGGVAIFWRRGRPLEGALFFSVFAIHREFLDLTLQARGYGFLAFFAGLASWGAVGWLDTGRWRWLVLLAAATVLGTWTVPTFALFGGGLLGLVFIREPRRNVLLASVVTAAFSAALYVPVRESFLEEIRLYPARWGRYYSSFDQVGETIRVFVFPEALFSGPVPPWLAFAFLAALVAGPGLLAKGRTRDREAVWILVSGSLLFLTACLFLTTPPLRVTAFVAVPLVVSFLRLFPPPSPRVPWLRPILAVGFSILLVPASIRAGRTLRFEPIENWSEVIRFLDATFPPAMGVHVMNAPHLLQPYIGDGRPIEKDVATGPAWRGERIWLDDQITGTSRFDGEALGPEALEVRVPQRRLGYQAIWFAPAAERHVKTIRSEDAGTGRRAFEVSLEPGRRYRSIAGRFVGRPAGVKLGEGGWLVTDSGWARLDGSRAIVTDRGFVVPLGDRAVRTVTLVLEGPDGQLPSLASLWAYVAG